MSPSSSTRLDITTHSDPGPRFYDTKTGITYDEDGNVAVANMSARDRSHAYDALYGAASIDPGVRWACLHPELARAYMRPSWWAWFKAFVKENW